MYMYMYIYIHIYTHIYTYISHLRLTGLEEATGEKLAEDTTWNDCKYKSSACQQLVKHVSS